MLTGRFLQSRRHVALTAEERQRLENSITEVINLARLIHQKCPEGLAGVA